MRRDIPKLRQDAALFLDFDGTLASIQEEPDAVMLPPGGADLLHALSIHLGGALAIISGRDIRDLAVRIPSTLWRIGGHGLDICPPGSDAPASADQAPEELLNALSVLASRFTGARIEKKGAVIALHYRAAPEAGPALADVAKGIIADTDGYHMQHGKMVIEAKPAAANKGEALRNMMQRATFAGRSPMMLGDDVTDEDAFAQALRMGGDAVKVGDGDTAARWRFADPEAVWRWLESSVNV